MFEKHFHLTENPFSLTPDPRFIFASRSHDEALATLRYWVEHREGFVMVTGEVGTGKTTSLFRLIDNLEQRFEIAFLTNSTLTPVELLEEICRKFKIEGLTAGMSKSALLQRLESYLVRLRDLRHAAILIIDEAQNFDQDLLEEVRLLSNTAAPSGPPLLQIALVGQPELERKLGTEELRQLRQRIGVHYKIEPLSEDETIRYIRHRIGVAGGNADIVFPAEGARALFRYTNGLPREINQVASQALLHAYVDGAPGVSPEHVKSAAWEMQFRSVLDRSDGTSPLSAAKLPTGPRAPGGPAPSAGPGPAGQPRTGVSAAPPSQVTLTPTLPPRTPAVVSPIGGPPGAVPPGAVPRDADTPAPQPPASLPPMAAPPAAPPPAVVVIPPTGGGSRTTPVLKNVTPIAAAAPLGKVPGTGTPEASEPGEKNGFLKRAGLVLGLVALLATAAALMFWPRLKPGDDVRDAQNERTLPSDSSDAVARQVLQGSALPPDFNQPTAADTGRAPAVVPGAGTMSAAADSANRNLPAAPGSSGPTNTAAPGSNAEAPVASSTPPEAVPPQTVPPQGSPAVSTPVAPVAPADGRLPVEAWRLQVASFRDSSLAQSEGRRVAGKFGWRHEVVRMRQKGASVFYAVFLGPFNTKADADSARIRMMSVKTGMKDPLVKGPRGPR